ncbi:hypothetical protein ACFL0I_02705 [Gemmatimonadota bacterium]
MMIASTPKLGGVFSLTLLFCLLAATPSVQPNQTAGTLSVRSVPTGVRVFIGPGNLSESVPHPSWGFNMDELLIGSEHQKGETPLELDLPAGEYQVGVSTKEITEEARAFFEEHGTPGVLQGCMSVRRPGAKERLVFVVREGELIMVAKVLSVTIATAESLLVEFSLFDF